MTTIATALVQARRSIDARDASVLLCHLLDCNTAYLAAHRDDGLDPTQAEAYAALVARRHAGEPVAYLTGQREFYGRMFHVAPGVLIPRPETELIIDIALQKFERNARLRILDLGTGSGCIAATLACEFPHASVTAVDIASLAIEIAQSNANRLGAKLRLTESNWFSALANECFDLVVANPPYIASHDPHLGAGDLRFEPPQALASGADGLDAIRHIVAAAPSHLAAHGWLLFEHGYDQGMAAQQLLREAGYREVEGYRDIAGIMRVAAGQRS